MVLLRTVSKQRVDGVAGVGVWCEQIFTLKDNGNFPLQILLIFSQHENINAPGIFRRIYECSENTLATVILFPT